MTDPHRFSISDELLSGYLDGELSAEERREVEQSLATSESLRRMYRELEVLREGLRELPRQHLDAGFAERVLERLAQVDAHPAATEAQRPDQRLRSGPPIRADRRDVERGWRRGVIWASLAVVAAVLLMLFQPPRIQNGQDVAMAPDSQVRAPADVDGDAADERGSAVADSARAKEVPDLSTGLAAESAPAPVARPLAERGGPLRRGEKPARGLGGGADQDGAGARPESRDRSDSRLTPQDRAARPLAPGEAFDVPIASDSVEREEMMREPPVADPSGRLDETRAWVEPYLVKQADGSEVALQTVLVVTVPSNQLEAVEQQLGRPAQDGAAEGRIGVANADSAVREHVSDLQAQRLTELAELGPGNSAHVWFSPNTVEQLQAELGSYDVQVIQFAPEGLGLDRKAAGAGLTSDELKSLQSLVRGTRLPAEADQDQPLSLARPAQVTVDSTEEGQRADAEATLPGRSRRPQAGKLTDDVPTVPRTAETPSSTGVLVILRTGELPLPAVEAAQPDP